MLPCIETRFRFGDTSVTALVPDPVLLNVRRADGVAAAPYWARIWPASIGLCEFLAREPQYLAGKRVLELAAGLGLPGLLAAATAAQVTLSDLDPEAVAVMKAAAVRNGLANVSCRVIDWTAIPEDLRPELVLLSDVNYDPALFSPLFDSMAALLEGGATIVLSTPQRLMAKPFIERLLPWMERQEEAQVGKAFVSVFVFKVKVKR